MIRQDSREGGIASNEQHKCIFLLLNLQVLYDCILWFHGKTQLRKIPDFIYRRYEWRVQLCTDQVYPEFIVVYERIFFHERFQAFWLQMTPSLKSVCYWKKAWFLQITSDFCWISWYFHAIELPDLRACCIHGMWYAMHVASFCYPCRFHMNIFVYIYIHWQKFTWLGFPHKVTTSSYIANRDFNFPCRPSLVTQEIFGQMVERCRPCRWCNGALPRTCTIYKWCRL